MPHILIVCTANICRSPMAMALLDRKLRQRGIAGDWQVSSAGTWARSGYPASEHGRNLMREWGMDIQEHRSRVVDETILQGADLVLTMEQGHKEAIRAEFPAVASRVYMLSEMVGFMSDVRDPYGGPASGYLETANELESYLEDGFDRIVALARGQGDG